MGSKSYIYFQSPTVLGTLSLDTPLTRAIHSYDLPNMLKIVLNNWDGVHAIPLE